MEAVKRVCSLSRPPMAPLPAFFFLTVAAFAARDTILPGEGISGNETLVSRNGVFELGFFSPGTDLYHFLGVRIRNMPRNAGTPKFWFGHRVYISDLSSAALQLFGDRLYITEAGAPTSGGQAWRAPETAPRRHPPSRSSSIAATWW